MRSKTYLSLSFQGSEDQSRMISHFNTIFLQCSKNKPKIAIYPRLPRFLNIGTIDVLDTILWGPSCALGGIQQHPWCSTHQMLEASYHTPHDNQKPPQTLPNVPWKQNHPFPPLETQLKLTHLFSKNQCKCSVD